MIFTFSSRGLSILMLDIKLILSLEPIKLILSYLLILLLSLLYNVILSSWLILLMLLL